MTVLSVLVATASACQLNAAASLESLQESANNNQDKLNMLCSKADNSLNLCGVVPVTIVARTTNCQETINFLETFIEQGPRSTNLNPQAMSAAQSSAQVLRNFLQTSYNELQAIQQELQQNPDEQERDALQLRINKQVNSFSTRSSSGPATTILIDPRPLSNFQSDVDAMVSGRMTKPYGLPTPTIPRTFTFDRLISDVKIALDKCSYGYPMVKVANEYDATMFFLNYFIENGPGLSPDNTHKPNKKVTKKTKQIAQKLKSGLEQAKQDNVVSQELRQLVDEFKNLITKIAPTQH